MNNIHSFKAASVQEAMARIHQELGKDAVVVETKTVPRSGLRMLFGRFEHVEIKAVASKSSSRRTRDIEKPPHSSRTVLKEGTVAQRASLQRAEISPGKGDNPLRQQFIASEFEMSTKGQSSLRIDSLTQFESVEEESNDSPVATPVTLEQPFSKLPQSLESRLESLEDLIRQCQFNVSINSKTEIPAELFGLYMSLIENDVSDDIARNFLSRMDHHRASDVVDTPASRSALLTAVIEREIPCVEPIVVRRGQRQIAMVVGPTGVGKTTTLAKLAGKLRLDGNIRVGFITFDTYRVAAVDQLQAYADIMRIPMKVVSNADELVEGLRDFASLDLVLIDTAGRSPMDYSAMNELTQITSVVPVDHLFLVLSLAAGTRSLINAVERFQSVRPTSLVLTKLDEVSGLGTILSITQRTQLPFAYTTDGQEVPTDIEPASSCRLARHIVGGGK